MSETTQTTETGPQVWIGCLASYNEGRLIGEWIDIPDNTDDLLDEITRILATTGGEEWYAGDIEGVPGYLRTDYPSVQQLTEYIEGLNRATDSDNGCAVDPDDIRVYGDGTVYADADIALALCESIGSLGDMLGCQVPDEVERYFDWEAYGRDLRIEGVQIIDGYAVEYID